MRSTLALRSLRWMTIFRSLSLSGLFFGGWGEVVAFRIIFLNLHVLWNCVVCICVHRWISTVCLSRLSGSGSKTRCSAHFPLHKVGQKEVCLNRAGLNPESMKAPRLLLKSFSRHSVNIVSLWTTCRRIYKGLLYKNGSMHCDTYVKVIQIQNWSGHFAQFIRPKSRYKIRRDFALERQKTRMWIQCVCCVSLQPNSPHRWQRLLVQSPATLRRQRGEKNKTKTNKRPLSFGSSNAGRVRSGLSRADGRRGQIVLKADFAFIRRTVSRDSSC